MRRVVSIALVIMMGAFVTLVWARQEREVAVADRPPAPGKPAPRAAPAPPALHRTLRTIALGWELIAPGVVASAGTASAYYLAGLEVSFGNATTMEDVASALARGGGEPGGADIAIVPLASYVAAYDRLRALSPEVMFVVGWSRGREALYGSDAGALARLPATGPIRVAGVAGRPETFLALFVLDLAGVPASRVELVDIDARAALTAAAKIQHQRTTGKLIVTSADTPYLMPIVAVAPRGFLQAHTAELEQWTKIWLTGVARLRADVPAGGRQVAATAGAPPVLAVIEGLGEVEFAGLRENAAAVGLSGRGALTLDEIFKTTWRLWREVGVITTPPPDAVPVHPDLIASLVRADPTSVIEARRPRVPATTGQRPAVLLVVRAPTTAGALDANAFVARIGLVAGVFDRIPLRIGVKADARAAAQLAEMARERFGLRAGQLSTTKRSPAGAVGSIEVLAAM